ncbi:hypothetical protein BH11BAC7_BH11BAC7_04240 [soil metagenome]
MEIEKKDRTDELRSQSVQEILSEIPNWIIRWGITVIFFTVGIILLASWIVHYPDIVTSRIVITAKNPPATGIQELSGIVTIPFYSYSKIKPGQTVNIKLDNYPFAQYGIVEGVVTGISEVPKDNAYAIEIGLPQGLSTTYKKTLAFKQGMQGVAEIVTDDRRIAQRIFQALSDKFKK